MTDSTTLAKRAERAEAEVERLRAALERIADIDMALDEYAMTPSNFRLRNAVVIALGALDPS